MVNKTQLNLAKKIFEKLKTNPTLDEYFLIDNTILQEVKNLLNAEIDFVTNQLDAVKETMDRLGLNGLKDPEDYWNKWVYKKELGLVSDMLSTIRAHEKVCEKANGIMQQYKLLAQIESSLYLALGIEIMQ